MEDRTITINVITEEQKEFNVAEKIKKLRKDNGLTQEQLAHKLDMKKATLASYEEGRSQPRITSLVSIARYFDVSVDYLITGKVTLKNGDKINGIKTSYAVKTNSSVFQSVRMKEPFVVKFDIGQIEGNEGDWLLIDETNKMYILTNEEYIKKYKTLETCTQ